MFLPLDEIQLRSADHCDDGTCPPCKGSEANFGTSAVQISRNGRSNGSCGSPGRSSKTVNLSHDRIRRACLLDKDQQHRVIDDREDIAHDQAGINTDEQELLWDENKKWNHEISYRVQDGHHDKELPYPEPLGQSWKDEDLDEEGDDAVGRHDQTNHPSRQAYTARDAEIRVVDINHIPCIFILQEDGQQVVIGH